jgi:alpha-tubulin suppressor-like RCC1 family protein
MASLLVPYRVGSGADWKAIATMSTSAAANVASSTFGIRTDGSLWAWGDDQLGQLGDGRTDEIQLTPEQIGSDTDWVSVVASVDSTQNPHAFAIKANGTLWGWGVNSPGVLGNGTQGLPVTAPQQIGSATNWKSIATADDHTVGIRTDGSLWGWGDDSAGQLGDAPKSTVLSPERVGVATNWSSVAVGPFYTLAIKTNGTLWGWGANDNGELGDGTDSQDPVAPEQIGTATTWKQVVATDEQQSPASFGLRTDGTLWGWGANDFGELGDGTTTERLAPKRIGVSSDWASVAHGAFRTFGVKTNGTLWAWGDNANGALGDGTTSSHHTPEQIGSETKWARVSAGALSTAALKTDGTVWVWGYDWFPDLAPHLPTLLPQWRTAPALVASSNHWSTLAAESNDVIAIRHDGTLWGWGWNTDGELGDNTVDAHPVAGQIGTDTDWQAVFGGENASFAIKQNGTLWSWGADSDGQLARDTNPFVPGQVGTDADWETVSGSRDHTVALKTDGTLWAWGNGLDGQLGTSHADFAWTPEQVGADTDWKTVAASDQFTLAVKNDGTLWAWGDNGHGQLGQGSVGGTALSPEQVGTDTNWSTVAARGNHVLALKTDGTLWAWGDNSDGALGDGTSGSDQSSPEQIGTGTTWSAIAPGTGHTIALQDDGTLWAWGDNTYGELGDGTTVSHDSPEQIGNDTNWRAIGAGYRYSVALDNSGGPTAPTAPTAVHATPSNHGAVVTWQPPPSDGGSPLTSYTITASPGGAAFAIDQSHLSFEMSGLANGTAYTFTVTATNAIGDSPPSPPSNAVIPDDGAPPRVQTTGPSAIVSFAGPLRVTWIATDPGGIAHYDVQRAVVPWNVTAAPWASWITATTSTSHSYTVAFGNTYCFRARAQDKAGHVSGWSSPRCSVFPLRAGQLSYSKGWTGQLTSAVFGGVDYYTKTFGATVTRTGVRAQRLYLVATECASCGTIQVLWNGKVVRAISLYRPTTMRKQLVALATFSRTQAGTLTVRDISGPTKVVIVEGLAGYNP